MLPPGRRGRRADDSRAPTAIAADQHARDRDRAGGGRPPAGADSRRVDLGGLRQERQRPAGRRCRPHPRVEPSSVAGTTRPRRPSTRRSRWPTAQERGLPVTWWCASSTRSARARRALRDGRAALRPQALAGEPLTVYGDGQQTRCFTTSATPSAACWRCSTRPAPGARSSTSAKPRRSRIRDAGRAAERADAAAAPRSCWCPTTKAYGAGFEDMRRRIPNVAKLRATIGFVPDTPLDETLRTILADLRR